MSNFKDCNDNFFLNIYKETAECFEKLERELQQETGEASRKVEYIRIALGNIQQLINIEMESIFPLCLFDIRKVLVSIQSRLLSFEKAIAQSTSKANAYKLTINESYQKVYCFNTKLKDQENNCFKETVENLQVTPRIKGLQDIAGLADAKKVLATIVILPIYQPQLFEGRKICNSVLLYGPPGTGKTLLAHALAAEISANFFSVTSSDILSQYVGQTEKIEAMKWGGFPLQWPLLPPPWNAVESGHYLICHNTLDDSKVIVIKEKGIATLKAANAKHGLYDNVSFLKGVMLQALFKTAKELRKDATVLFIDEIDGLCRSRHSSESEWNRRLKTEFMCQLSNFEDARNTFLICATNCPWDLDCAFLRRFQRRIYVPLPTAADRYAILQLLVKDKDIHMPSTLCGLLLSRTEGYSGSDLADVVRNAFNIPITELLDTKCWKSVDNRYQPATENEYFTQSTINCSLLELPAESIKARDPCMGDLMTALDVVLPTVSKSDVKRYESFMKNT